MAFPVIPEKYLADFPKEEKKEQVKQAVVAAASKVNKGVAGILDFLIILTAAFWYYFFTGIAVARGKKIPKEWMALGKPLGMTRVSSHIKQVAQKRLQEVVASKNAPKKTYKVMDLDSKRPMKVLKVNS